MKTVKRGAHIKALLGIIILFLILFLFNERYLPIRASGIHKGTLTEKNNVEKREIKSEKFDFSSVYLFSIFEEEEENKCYHVLAIGTKDSSENSFLIGCENTEKYLSYRKYLFTTYPLYLLNQSLLI